MTSQLPPSFDLLLATPPVVSDAEAEGILNDLYGISGNLKALYSERDANFRVFADNGSKYLLKIANQAEGDGITEFQTGALEHVARVEPGLPIPRVIRTRDDALLGQSRIANAICNVRLLGWIDGDLIENAPASAELRRSLGTSLARLNQALRGYFHPAARFPLAWDITRVADLRGLLQYLREADFQAICQQFLDRFEQQVQPHLAALRAQVIHNDFNPGNVLYNPAAPDRVAGVIDFGDMVHGPVIVDLAVAAAYQLTEDDDPLASALDLISAFNAVLPIEELEADLLFDLMAARWLTTVLITNWRAARYPDNRDYILRSAGKSRWLLEHFAGRTLAKASDRVRQACGIAPRQTGAGNTTEHLLERRQRLLGPAYRLFYAHPLHLVRGRGVWLHDCTGQRYLDVYNNVAHVGHCHPRVVNAIHRQLKTLNTHTRYLHDNVLKLAERLTAKAPEALSVAMFCCSGSEANDLALRIARSATGGRGVIVTEHAYHGTTQAIHQLSTDSFPAEELAPHVVTIPSPDLYHGLYRGEDAGERYAEHVEHAIGILAGRGIKPAAMIVDTVFSSDGIVTPPVDFLGRAAAMVRQHGGLFIADEVQAGFGRSGENFWGFEAYGVEPDIVTMGKPIGNGHPISALLTRPDLAEQFSRDSRYFNTFAGNPVSCAAALAVLDVISDEGLQDNARQVGKYLRKGLRELAQRYPIIGDVRGKGLFNGVELVRDREDLEPAVDEAQSILNQLKDHGVLAGVTGRFSNVLKFRPPLVFSNSHADVLLQALDQVLAAMPLDGIKK